MSWERGKEVIDRLLAEHRLERITGAAANGTELMVSAEKLLLSARREVELNPEAAFILAYDCARKSSILATREMK